MKKTAMILPAVLAMLMTPLAQASINVTGGSIDRRGVQKASIKKPHIEGPQVKVGVHGVRVEKPHVEGPKVTGPKVEKPHINAPEITIKPGAKK